MTAEHLNILTDLIDYLLASETRNPVVSPSSPDHYRRVLDLKVGDQGMADDDVARVVKKILDHVPKTSTDRFFNQLFGGRQPVAVIGEMLAALLNTSMYTYKVAGPMVLIEQVLLREISNRVGYADSAQGAMAAGGSMTNLMAVIMARDRVQPSATQHGVTGGLVGYTSEASHYSIAKNASIAGLGRASMRKVPTDNQGKMCVASLADMIAADLDAGNTPFFVNATAGTTVLGAFDPIADIYAVTRNYPHIWLHIDGAYCGAVIWSNRYKYLVDGSDLSDSFSVNAHKMLGTPLSTSFIVVKDGSQMYKSFADDASYLFQTDSDDLNPGKVSLQCGRRNDALKFWMLYKSKGNIGLEQMVDHQMDLARQARQYVADHPDYTLYSNDDTVSVCFNYKDIDPQRLCLDLYEAGELMVGYGSFDENIFVRLVIVNANNSWTELAEFFVRIEKFVQEHYSISEKTYA